MAGGPEIGRYEGSSQDRTDGFIHFSSAEQVRESAAKHRAGQTDLLLLSVDSAQLGDPLKWEASRGGAMFPHLYGPLPSKRFHTLMNCRWMEMACIYFQPKFQIKKRKVHRDRVV